MAELVDQEDWNGRDMIDKMQTQVQQSCETAYD